MHIIGYPSAIYFLAKYSEENKIKDLNVKSVVSLGDKLFKHYRKTISKNFNTEVFDTYGACEGTMIAAECEYHTYHIMSPHVYIEILDENGNEVKDGELGNIHVTHLDNFLMPLIRYKIGDLGVKSSPDYICNCGRSLPVLKHIIGRDTDVVYTESGKPLIVHFFTGIFEHFSTINQFQVVQKNNEPFNIKYIPGDGFKVGTLDKIRSHIIEKSNEHVEFKFIEVSRISPTASGKPQIIVRQ